MQPAERKLYVGAPVRCPGWEVYHETEHDDVDHVGGFQRLHGLPRDAFSIVYVTVLDRLNLRTQARRAMHDWFAALRPGGTLMLTTVDQAAVGRLLATSAVSLDLQLILLRAQATASHWTAEVLSLYLQSVGFRNVRRAERFGLFNDASEVGEISLNVMADRPQ